jgi:phosphopantothenoylcysteine synthetase/decarboxylase
MTVVNALKIFTEQLKVDKGEGYGEAADRELAGYALKYKDDEPMKNSSGEYVLAGSSGNDVEDAPEMWRELSKIHSKEKMMKITVSEAASLKPAVRKIIAKKIEVAMKAFKGEASENTKKKYEAASLANKRIILSAWLKSKKGKEGGRKTRRSTRRGTRRN